MDRRTLLAALASGLLAAPVAAEAQQTTALRWPESSVVGAA